MRAAVAAVLLLGAARVGAAPAELCPAITAADARGAAERAVGWLAANQRANGQWDYLVDEEGRSLGGYNVVRHGGVLLSLEQAAARGIDAARPVADAGRAWALDHLVDTGDGRALVEVDGTVKTGASALFARSLLERRAATGDTRYDDVLVDLGHFLAGQVLPSGALSARWDPASGERVDDARDRFATGEAYWALISLAELFPDEGFEEARDRLGAYLPFRDEDEGMFPPFSDHWASYAYAELGLDRLTPDQRHHAERLVGLFGAQVRMESTRYRDGLQNTIRRGPAQGSGVGTLGEGGASLLALFEDEEPGVVDGLRERLHCNASMLVERQVTDGSDDVRGAWFRDGVTRMDDQQHAMSALLFAEELLAGADVEPVGGGEEPHGFLWVVLASVAIANPLRWRKRPGVLRTGAASCALAATALLSGPILDGLDVSPASARIAAGAAVVLAGIVVAVGRGAAVVDGIVVATLFLAALSYGADDGAMVLAGIVVASWLVTFTPKRWRTPVGAAALALVSVFVGVDLIVEGVLGV